MYPVSGRSPSFVVQTPASLLHVTLVAGPQAAVDSQCHGVSAMAFPTISVLPTTRSEHATDGSGSGVLRTATQDIALVVPDPRPTLFQGASCCLPPASLDGRNPCCIQSRIKNHAG